jgi:hypothetical protein
MISFKAYRSLKQDVQAQLLWSNGVYLELIRCLPRMNVELYSLYGFYVEIYFDNTTQEPLYIKAFEKVKYLEPYLPLIDIESLFQVK